MGKELIINYCKFGNFLKIFIFANSVKRYSCDIKKSRLGHDLSISLNDRVISPFPDDFFFHETSHMRRFAKINPLRKYPNLQ